MNEGLKILIKKCYDTHEDITAIKEPMLDNGNACFDFYAPEKYVIQPHQQGKVLTGWAFEIPEGYHMKLFMRSSYGAKRKLRLSNCVGIVDSSYRGEVMALFDNIGDMPEIIEKGERFLQGLIEKNIPVEFKEVTTLTETQRGKGGFGSTGRF